MKQVEVKRAYRVLSTLDTTAKELKDQAIPELVRALTGWRNWTLRLDTLVLAALVGALVFAGLTTGFWLNPMADAIAAAAALVVLGLFHWIVSGIFKLYYRRRLARRQRQLGLRFNLVRAFNKCANWRLFATGRIRGWGEQVERELEQIINRADVLIQRLNDQMTNPSGKPVETRKEERREAVAEAAS